MKLNKLEQERYDFFKEQLNKYETKEQKLEYLETVLFSTEMIDRWSETDGADFIALNKLIKELKEE